MTPLFAAVNWLDISINLLLVIHVIVCLLLALVVLMQRPKQEGLGAAFGSGLTDQAFGARTTDVLQKGTVYLGTLFFIITLVLAILIGKRQKSGLNMTVKADTEEVSPAADAPVTLPKKDAEKAPVVMPDAPKTEKTDSKVEAPKKEEPKKEAPKASDEKTPTEPATEEPK